MNIIITMGYYLQGFFKYYINIKYFANNKSFKIAF